jgi:hypothetical protein
MRGVQQRGDCGGVLNPPASDVCVARGIERPLDGMSSAVKEDLPWNRCC